MIGIIFADFVQHPIPRGHENCVPLYQFRLRLFHALRRRAVGAHILIENAEHGSEHFLKGRVVIERIAVFQHFFAVFVFQTNQTVKSFRSHILREPSTAQIHLITCARRICEGKGSCLKRGTDPVCTSQNFVKNRPEFIRSSGQRKTVLRQFLRVDGKSAHTRSPKVSVHLSVRLACHIGKHARTHFILDKSIFFFSVKPNRIFLPNRFGQVLDKRSELFGYGI